MQLSWWKILTIILLFYVVIGGMLMPIPHVDINDETSRNLYYHVPMWFGMTLILTVSMVYAIRYLKKPTELNDLYSVEAANVGILFGILGIVTGMIWAQYTWGTYWHGDPKQNASAIFLLIYLAYMVLRGAIQDNQQKAKIAAIYNIFAYATMIPLLFILPRLTASLHPGNGGNPGFNIYDSDGKMKLVFYPAVIGWTLLGWWIVTLRVRMNLLINKYKEQMLEKEVEVS